MASFHPRRDLHACLCVIVMLACDCQRYSELTRTMQSCPWTSPASVNSWYTAFSRWLRLPQAAAAGVTAAPTTAAEFYNALHTFTTTTEGSFGTFSRILLCCLTCCHDYHYIFM